ncbi:MAG TPA: FixH family protein [Cyclobacteriaceae bacterium]|nr:FixH family protein [Cyclobacteriaceae bacterium]
MNWGNWIVVSFVLFAAFIATLVTVCVRQDISLVTRDYYKEELVYQSQLDRMNNAAKLERKPVISVVKNESLRVEFNPSDEIQHGALQLFCPSNDRFDRQFEIASSSGNKLFFPITNLQKGMYRAKLTWTMKGKEYYMEEVIHL